MENDIATEDIKRALNDDVHKTDSWLTSGGVEVERIGDVVSGPRTVLSQEPLDGVLYLYLIEGSACVELSDVGVQELTSNDALIVFPWRIATVELTAPKNRLMLMTLRGGEAVDSTLQFGYWDGMRFSVGYAGNYMGEIVERFHASPLRGRDPHVLSLIEQLLETVWLRARNSSNRGELLDAVRMINRMPNDGLTTESASTALGISRSKLNTLFLSCLGMRPGEYVSQIFLARSLAMLFWTKLSVAIIAERMGFANASAFASFVRRRTGLTPSEFRKKPIPILA